MNNPIIEAVPHLVNGTSNNSHILIQAEPQIILPQFKNSVIWKEFWLKYEERSETYSEEEGEEDCL